MSTASEGQVAIPTPSRHCFSATVDRLGHEARSLAVLPMPTQRRSVMVASEPRLHDFVSSSALKPSTIEQISFDSSADNPVWQGHPSFSDGDGHFVSIIAHSLLLGKVTTIEAAVQGLKSEAQLSASKVAHSAVAARQAGNT